MIITYLKRVSSAAQSGTATFPRSELIYTIPGKGAMQGRSQSQVTWAVAELSSPGAEAARPAIGLTCVGGGAGAPARAGGLGAGPGSSRRAEQASGGGRLAADPGLRVGGRRPRLRSPP